MPRDSHTVSKWSKSCCASSEDHSFVSHLFLCHYSIYCSLLTQSHTFSPYIFSLQTLCVLATSAVSQTLFFLTVPYLSGELCGSLFSNKLFPARRLSGRKSQIHWEIEFSFLTWIFSQKLPFWLRRMWERWSVVWLTRRSRMVYELRMRSWSTDWNQWLEINKTRASAAVRGSCYCLHRRSYSCLLRAWAFPGATRCFMVSLRNCLSLPAVCIKCQVLP